MEENNREENSRILPISLSLICIVLIVGLAFVYFQGREMEAQIAAQENSIQDLNAIINEQEQVINECSQTIDDQAETILKHENTIKAQLLEIKTNHARIEEYWQRLTYFYGFG